MAAGLSSGGGDVVLPAVSQRRPALEEAEAAESAEEAELVKAEAGRPARRRAQYHATPFRYLVWSLLLLGDALPSVSRLMGLGSFSRHFAL